MQRSVTELLTTPEGKTFECKRDLSSPQNLLKTLVAFANSAGGLALIGVADGTREVIGLPEPLQAEEQLCNLIADGIAPRLVPGDFQERCRRLAPIQAAWRKSNSSSAVVSSVGSLIQTTSG